MPNFCLYAQCANHLITRYIVPKAEEIEALEKPLKTIRPHRKET
jgi:hypothetical protein